MCENCKNTATIDIDRYNQLLNKERALEGYINDNLNVILFKRDHYSDAKYKVLSDDDAIQKLGAIHNNLVNDSVTKLKYEQVKNKYEQVKNNYENLQLRLEEIIKEQARTLNWFRNMTTKEFKRWKRNS